MSERKGQTKECLGPNIFRPSTVYITATYTQLLELSKQK